MNSEKVKKAVGAGEKSENLKNRKHFFYIPNAAERHKQINLDGFLLIASFTVYKKLNEFWRYLESWYGYGDVKGQVGSSSSSWLVKNQKTSERKTNVEIILISWLIAKYRNNSHEKSLRSIKLVSMFISHNIYKTQFP